MEDGVCMTRRERRVLAEAILVANAEVVSAKVRWREAQAKVERAEEKAKRNRYCIRTGKYARYITLPSDEMEVRSARSEEHDFRMSLKAANRRRAVAVSAYNEVLRSVMRNVPNFF